MLAAELVPHQAQVEKGMRSPPNGPAYAAMAASLRRQQEAKRASNPSNRGSEALNSSGHGSLRSSVAAGGSVGASSATPASPLSQAPGASRDASANGGARAAGYGHLPEGRSF